MALDMLDIDSATKLLDYLYSKQDKLVQALVQQRSLKEALAKKYVSYLDSDG